MAAGPLGLAFGRVDQCPDQLLGDADAAMYAAKADGKGHYQIFAPEMHKAILARLELAVDLAGAMERGELCVVYQPIVELATGCILGAEALVRWQHPDRGLIPPLEFIPIAEASGQIFELGSYVLRQALNQLAQWQHDDLSFYVTVNVSPAQVRHPRFLDIVALAVDEAAVNLSRLVLELTETGLMSEVEDHVA